MEFKFKQSPVSESEVRRVEALWGERLPEMLRRTVLAHNGAAILSEHMKIDSLISFSEKDEGNIYASMKLLMEQRLPDLLPFGTDIDGNLFCLQKQNSLEPSIVLLHDDTLRTEKLYETFSEFWISLGC